MTGTLPEQEQQTRPKDSRTLIEVLCVAVPKVLAGLLQLQMGLLLTRHLGPENAGLLFVTATAVLLADAILGAAVDLTVLRLSSDPRPGQQIQSAELQKGALVLKVVAVLLVSVALFPFSASMSSWLFRSPQHGELLLIGAGSLASLLTLRSVQTHFQVARRFWLYGAADLLHSAVKWGGAAWLMFLGNATPSGVLTFYFAAPAITTVIFLGGFGKCLITARTSWRALKLLMKEMRWYLASGVVGSTTSRMDLLLISSSAGPVQAGIFAAAVNLTLPLQLLGQYMGVVFAPRIMPLWRDGRLKKIYTTFQLALAGAAVLIALAMAGVLGWLVPYALGPNFQRAVPTSLWLLPSAACALINFPWTISVVLFARPSIPAVFDLCAIPVLVILYYIAIARDGAVGAAVVTSAYAIVKTCVFQYLGAKSVAKNTIAATQILSQ
ncbi:MAG: hypothetical protein H7039_10030 [Bryobacteraceae bacterium]|nr:hypothetical protein [Bryobacteraceae bacterium]